jgi:hypothetical protein
LQGGTSKDASGSSRSRRNMAGSAPRCGEYTKSPIALVRAIMATMLTVDADQRMHVEALLTETSSSSGVADMSERSIGSEAQAQSWYGTAPGEAGSAPRASP